VVVEDGYVVDQHRYLGSCTYAPAWNLERLHIETAEVTLTAQLHHPAAYRYIRAVLQHKHWRHIKYRYVHAIA
jgi:hypothetical protein